LKFKRNYTYEVKRKATIIEELPAPIPEEQKEVKITSYLKVLILFGRQGKRKTAREKEFALFAARRLHM
jgi:hypothetical protein